MKLGYNLVILSLLFSCDEEESHQGLELVIENPSIG